MFTLAQYVFGIGKTETSSPALIDDNTSASTDTAYHENDDPNQCVQTNIENDWILIEIEQKNSNASQAEARTAAAALQGPRKPRVKSIRSKALALEKVQSQEESWFVEPPECFKHCSPDSRDVKTSSLENLLIEHPSMSVFDNLFTKRVIPVKIEPLKPSLKLVASKKAVVAGEKAKENTPTVRSNNKKKQVDFASVNVLTVSNQNKALTAIIQQSGETFHKKKCITKKNYERQNKVVVQRNGPIIRHKKMFAHPNGVYHTRNHY